MEALILILAIAIVVGFIIFKSSSEEALEVLDRAKSEKAAEAAAAQKPVTKTAKKPQPVKAQATKTTAVKATTGTKDAAPKATATKTAGGRKKKV